MNQKVLKIQKTKAREFNQISNKFLQKKKKIQNIKKIKTLVRIN